MKMGALSPNPTAKGELVGVSSRKLANIVGQSNPKTAVDNKIFENMIRN